MAREKAAVTCDVAVEVTLNPSLELCLGMDVGPTESLWVRIEEQTALGNIVVSVCCGTPGQEEEVDEAFKQLKTTSCMQSLALGGKFSFSNICWKRNISVHNNPGGIDDNFLTQVVKDLTRRGSLLDLIHANMERLTGNVKVEGSLGYYDPKMLEFKILRARRGSQGKIGLDFRRAILGLCKNVLVRSH